MSYQGDRDSRSYEGLGPMGYEKPFPDGKPPHPTQTYSPQRQPENSGVVLQLSAEEQILAKQIRQKHNLFTFLPVAALSFIGLRHLFQKGLIKSKNPHLYYIGAGFLTFINTKIVTYRDFKRQALEKYPNGVFAQTLHMNGAERMEYMKRRKLEGLSQDVLTPDEKVKKFDPESRNQLKGLDDRFRPNMDNFEPILKPKEEDPSQPVTRTSYATLRQQAHRDALEERFTRSPPPSITKLPEVPSEQDNLKPLDEVPSPQPRRVKRNKYGDEMD